MIRKYGAWSVRSGVHPGDRERRSRRDRVAPTLRNVENLETSDTQWADEYDVIIVGSGGGALAGAYTAGRSGLSTLVLEKTRLLGGMTSYSGAAVWWPGNRIGLPHEEGDSVDEALDFLLRIAGPENKDLAETYVRSAPEVSDFLCAHPDFNLEWNRFPDYFEAPSRRIRGRSLWPSDMDPERLGDLLGLVRPSLDHDRAGRPHPREKVIRGRSFIAGLLLAGKSTGNVEYRVESPMTELVVEDGRVVGVVATCGGQQRRFRARRGVLLAAGGYEGNADLRTETGVPGRSEWTMAPQGANTGDAILAAVAHGAATDLMGDAWWAPGVKLAEGRPGALMMVFGGIMVGADGERFANESMPYDQIGRVLAGNNRDGSLNDSPREMPLHYIFDSRAGGEPPAIVMPTPDAEELVASGAWVRADTVEELAEKIGVPPKALTRTLRSWNSACISGSDQEFHRGEDPYDLAFAHGDSSNPALVPLDSPPYYAAPMVICDLGTKGGLVIDTDGRVLRQDGNAIEGLYASGNTTASLTRNTYPGPGFPVGLATVFAYRAAKHMATG